MRNIVVLDNLSLSVDRNGSGPSFVWGHGLTSSMELEGDLLDFNWASIAAHTEVIRYDARGHRRSTLTPELSDYSWQCLAEDQLALADALDVTTYIAGGASMGAQKMLPCCRRSTVSNYRFSVGDSANSLGDSRCSTSALP